MIVSFYQPPVQQRQGGLDLAITSLRDFLARSGVTVREDPDVETVGKSSEPEVVHFHGLWQRKHSQISGELRSRSVPYIVSTHGMLEPWAWRHKWWKKWPYFYVVERKHLSGAQKLLATSRMEARNISKFFPDERCTVLPFGLTSSHAQHYTEARAKLGWEESEVVILFLSRVHPKKNLPALFQAIALLDRQRFSRPMRVVIVGGGDAKYVQSVKKMVSALSTLPRVDWIGEVWGEGKWDYLQGADLMCLPSFSENFGFSVLESLQVGTRVITTDQTPWESIESWNAGRVIRPTVNDLLKALSAFLEDSEWPDQQRQQLAAQTRDRYAWGKIGPGYIELYEAVSAKRAA